MEQEEYSLGDAIQSVEEEKEPKDAKPVYPAPFGYKFGMLCRLIYRGQSYHHER